MKEALQDLLGALAIVAILFGAIIYGADDAQAEPPVTKQTTLEWETYCTYPEDNMPTCLSMPITIEHQRLKLKGLDVDVMKHLLVKPEWQPITQPEQLHDWSIRTLAIPRTLQQRVLDIQSEWE